MTIYPLPEKISDWLITGSFLLIIFISPLLTLLNPGAEYSKAEKRRLAPFPEVALDYSSFSKFPDQFDAYVQDHFGLRDWFIHRYHREMQKRFDISGASIVITGKNNWYYFASQSQVRDLEGRSFMFPDELEAIKSALLDRKKWLQNQGIEYLFVTPPNKQSIYPEFLPDTYSKTFKTTQLDNIVGYVNSAEEKLIVDLREPLLSRKSEYRLYHKNDTHWNRLGAVTAFEALAKELEDIFPGIKINKPYSFSGRWIKGVRGDLAIMGDLSESIHEKVPLVKGIPFCSQKEPFQNQQALDEQGFGIQPYVTKCGNNGLKAIIFYDSFIEAMEPILTANFSQILYVRTRFDQELALELISSFQPDIVIEELVERDLHLLYE